MRPNAAPKCPKCGTELSWSVPLSDTSGRAKCPSGAYMKHGVALGAYCGWSGTVYRHSNGGVSLAPPEVAP